MSDAVHTKFGNHHEYGSELLNKLDSFLSEEQETITTERCVSLFENGNTFILCIYLRCSNRVKADLDSSLQQSTELKSKENAVKKLRSERKEIEKTVSEVKKVITSAKSDLSSKLASMLNSFILTYIILYLLPIIGH